MGRVIESVEDIFPERNHFAHELIIRIESKQISFFQHQHRDQKNGSHAHRLNQGSDCLLL